MFVIITNGEENASREYSAEKVKTQIERQKEKYGWEFVFLGANIDAMQTAGCFGIAPSRAMNYLGGDSDTLAAITGSIAEVAYGIPQEIADKALSYLDAPLREVYDRFSDFVQTR